MATMSTQYNHRLLRCVTNTPVDNHTIHLVHSSRRWSKEQLKLVESISQTFLNHTILVTVMKDPNFIFSERPKREINDNKITNKTNRIIKMLLPNKTDQDHNEKTIEEIAEKHPNVLLMYQNYNEMFDKTPLSFNWVMFNDKMRIFAVRVLQLWQYGGISFDLFPYEKSESSISEKTQRYNTLTELIKNGKQRFENLEADQVSVDNLGFHMESRVPCHAFFGKVLMRLKKANPGSTAKCVLRGPLYSFCKMGAVEKKFCGVL